MFKKLIILYYIILTLSSLKLSNGYRVEMIVNDEGSSPQVTTFEIVNHNNPPFETETGEHIEDGMFSFFRESFSETDTISIKLPIDTKFDNGERVKKDGVQTSGFSVHERHKRSLNQRQDKCVKNRKESAVSNQAITVEIGEMVRLPCHGCDDDEHEMFESMQWLKLDQFPNSKGLYHIKEVVPDIHDEEKLNRVSLTLDHTLILRKAKMSDSGSYFCKPVDRNSNFINLRLNFNELQEYISKESHMRYFFHVDVIDLKRGDTIDVSSHSKTKPLQPEVIPILNIEISTRWRPWTSCSVCEDDGIRKRIGICVVKKHDLTKRIQHGYLRNVLNFSKNGIPCQSQFLRDFHDEPWLQRPNQIQIEECNVPCHTTASQRRKRGITSIFSRSEIKDKEKLDEKNAKIKARKKEIRVGSYFILKCPGISLSKTVNWVNGTQLVHIIKIQKSSNNRITIDMFGNLHFKAAKLSDSGVYSCWLKKKLKYKYEVNIEEDKNAEIKKYTIYLCATFIFDFAVFVILSVIKFLQRKAQRRRKKKAKEKADDSDDTPYDNNDVDKSDGSIVSSETSDSD